MNFHSIPIQLGKFLIFAILLNFVGYSSATRRLPNDTVPIHYDLHLTTNIHLDNFDFEGRVTIYAQCISATKRITLHSRELKIRNVCFDGLALDPEQLEFEEEKDFLHINLPNELEIGRYFYLTLDYEGHHNGDKDFKGWYRAKDNTTDAKWFVTSQFEPSGARKAFPCYDEPNRKATFRISITHTPQYVALSNMAVVGQRPEENGLMTTEFAITPTMSTYLAAFVVAPMKSNCREDARGRRHCFYVLEQYLNETEKWLLKGMRAIDHYETMFKIDYPLVKMDHVVIPDGYRTNGSAMENWGLIIYDLLSLKVDKTVIYHEVAHQWFGNLVTLDWWSVTWLNEGFATLLALPDPAIVYPLYNLTMYNERPLNNYTEYGEDHFDFTSYLKGAAILNMVLLTMGKETFYKGLNYYLTARIYSNASPADLYQGLQQAVAEDDALPKGLTVAEIMDSWTLQAGYPIVTAQRTSPTEVTLSVRKSLENSTDQGPFIIPLAFMEDVGGLHNETIYMRGDNVPIRVNAKSKWFFVTKNLGAVHHEEYEEENWRQLAEQLKEDPLAIPEENRKHIVWEAQNSGHKDVICSDEYIEKEANEKIRNLCRESDSDSSEERLEQKVVEKQFKNSMKLY